MWVAGGQLWFGPQRAGARVTIWADTDVTNAGWPARVRLKSAALAQQALSQSDVREAGDLDGERGLRANVRQQARGSDGRARPLV